MEFTIEVVGFDPICQRMANPQFAKLVAVNFAILGQRVTYLMRCELREIRYTGALENSVAPTLGRLEVRIAPTAGHAPYVYEGTRPHWAPIAPLKAWAAAKLGDPQAGYAVQRSIAKHGTSVWAARRYGTSGGNPFPERTMERGDTQTAITNTARRLGIGLVARVAGG